MKKLLLLILLPSFVFGQNIEEMIKEKTALIELDTDSLTKVKLRFEDSLLNLHTSHKTILKPFKEKLQLFSHKKNEIDSDLSAVRNDNNILSNKVQIRYGDTQTIKRIAIGTRKLNPSGWKRIEDKLKINLDSITLKIDRSSQINYYQLMSKCKFIFHKLNPLEINRYINSTSKVENKYIYKSLTVASNEPSSYDLQEPICYIDLNKYNEFDKLPGFRFGTVSNRGRNDKAIPSNEGEVAIATMYCLISSADGKDRFRKSGKQVLFAFPSHKYLFLRKGYKKNKLDANLKEKGFYLLEGQDKEDYLYALTGIDKNYFDLMEKIKVFDSTINELTAKMELVNKDESNCKTSIKNIEQKQKREINLLTSKIAVLTNKIDSKDERIEQFFLYYQPCLDAKTVEIGDLEVMTIDLRETGPSVYGSSLTMNWGEAKKACENLGNGWRLPTKDELNILYQNKYTIGGFAYSFWYEEFGKYAPPEWKVYWSSTENNNQRSVAYGVAYGGAAWWQEFESGTQLFSLKNHMNNNYHVRAVRSID